MLGSQMTRATARSITGTTPPAGAANSTKVLRRAHADWSVLNLLTSAIVLAVAVASAQPANESHEAGLQICRRHRNATLAAAAGRGAALSGAATVLVVHAGPSCPTTLAYCQAHQLDYIALGCSQGCPQHPEARLCSNLSRFPHLPQVATHPSWCKVVALRSQVVHHRHDYYLWLDQTVQLADHAATADVRAVLAYLAPRAVMLAAWEDDLRTTSQPAPASSPTPRLLSSAFALRNGPELLPMLDRWWAQGVALMSPLVPSSVDEALTAVFVPGMNKASLPTARFDLSVAITTVPSCWLHDWAAPHQHDGPHAAEQHLLPPHRPSRSIVTQAGQQPAAAATATVWNTSSHPPPAKRQALPALWPADSAKVALFHTVTSNFEHSHLFLLARAHLWAYCARHGYSYRAVIHKGNAAGSRWSAKRTGHWLKIKSTLRLMELFEIVVAVDLDVHISSPFLSLDAMLQPYGFLDRPYMAAAAEDPGTGTENWVTSTSGAPILQINTGFMVWRSSARARVVLNAWWHSVTHVPELCYWRNHFTVDQGAFNMYIRNELMGRFDLLVLPCDHFNGRPPVAAGCHGDVVSHWWSDPKFPLLIALRKSQISETDLGKVAKKVEATKATIRMTTNERFKVIGQDRCTAQPPPR